MLHIFLYPAFLFRPSICTILYVVHSTWHNGGVVVVGKAASDFWGNNLKSTDKVPGKYGQEHCPPGSHGNYAGNGVTPFPPNPQFYRRFVKT